MIQNQGADGVRLPLDALGKNPLPASSTFCWLLAFRGVCPHHSGLCFCGHSVLSSLGRSSLSLSPIRTLVITSGPLGKPSWSPAPQDPQLNHTGKFFAPKHHLEIPEWVHAIFRGHESTENGLRHGASQSAPQYSLKVVIFVRHFAISVKAGWTQPNFFIRQWRVVTRPRHLLSPPWKVSRSRALTCPPRCPRLLGISRTWGFWDDDFSLPVRPSCFRPPEELISDQHPASNEESPGSFGKSRGAGWLVLCSEEPGQPRAVHTQMSFRKSRATHQRFQILFSRILRDACQLGVWMASRNKSPVTDSIS